MSAHAQVARVTAETFGVMKRARDRIVMLTAYDFHSARLVDAAGIDAILVGDSMGMTVLGHDSTLPVTVDDIVSATRAVARGATRAMVIADMPFMSYQVSREEGMRNAGRMLAEAGAQAVKLEGASASTLGLVSALTEAGVPVMGHLGLTPQSVNVFGGYKTQARDVTGAAKLMHDAVALQEAGAFAIVLECVPAQLAERVTEMLDIATIGIGAGVGCDGEVQVFHDLLGMGDFLPRHAKRYADLAATISDAVARYGSDVRERTFPEAANATSVDEAVIEEASALNDAHKGGR